MIDNSNMCSTLRLLLVAWCVTILMVDQAALAQRDVVKDHPGYVDSLGFAELAGEDDRLIEITLGPRMLELFSRRADRRRESILADILGGLVSLRAVVAEVSSRQADADSRIRRITDRVRERGWEQFVHVREPECSEFTAYIHTNGDDVDGLLVIGFTEPSEAIFVNLVGKVDMERMFVLGERLGLPALDELPPRSEVENRKKSRSDGPPRRPRDDGEAGAAPSAFDPL